MDSIHIGRRMRLIKRIFLIISAVMLVVALVMIAVFDRQKLILVIIVSACAILIFLTSMFFPILTRILILKVANRNYRIEPNKTTGKHKLSISMDSVTDSSNEGESTTHWNAIEWIESTDQYLFMMVQDSVPHIVPRRAFTDEQAFKRFVDTAEAYHHASMKS